MSVFCGVGPDLFEDKAVAAYLCYRYAACRAPGCNEEQLAFGPVQKLVMQISEFDYHSERLCAPSSKIVDTMQTVLQAFFSSDSFSDCLLDILSRGGDSAMSTAIAGMLAGSYYRLSSIPAEWLQGLDQSVMASCTDQAMALLTMDYEQSGRSEPNKQLNKLHDEQRQVLI